MARSRRPILDAAAGNVLAMIAMHQDRPCPSNAEVREWTGVPRRRVTSFLANLVARGVIEIETVSKRARRRMRAAGGVWTGWTLRGRYPARPIPAGAVGKLLATIVRHRGRPCPTTAQIAKTTGVPGLQVPSFLEGLEARGIVEIESQRGGRRRLRASGGAWTGWTVRHGNAVRPIPAAAEAQALALIRRHRGRPCPNRAEMAGATGVPCWQVESFLAGLAARGVIEIEIKGRQGLPRRMRASGGAWTGWLRGGKPK